MRCIDADALEKEGWSLHRTIRVDMNTEEYQTKPLKQVPTIEPRCEACEAINKTRLLIPQPQRTGRWIHDGYAFKGGIDWMHCSECGHKDSWSVATRTPFCAWCGARMEDPEDIPMEYFESGGR